MKKITLEQILEKEKSDFVKNGAYSLEACKEQIRFTKEHLGVSYYIQLEKYVESANASPFFNRTMVLACWQLINNNF